MNEAETRAEHIDPALKAAGWGVVEGSRVRREFPITLGRLEGHGRRGKSLTADYVLEYRNTKLAVIEAKAWDCELTDGVAQAKDYAGKLAVRFTYSSNGQGIYEIDMHEGVERDGLAGYPTPDELWQRTYAQQSNWRDRFAAVPYPDKSGQWSIRYYQDTAVERVLEKVATGGNRILLTLATGTGKTSIAFQIAWKLFQAKWSLSGAPTRRPRILFLADRNTLATQAYNDFNSFAAFEDEALVRISPDEIRKKGAVPTNASVFFTIFQTFMSGQDSSFPRKRESSDDGVELDSRLRGNDGDGVHGSDGQGVSGNDSEQVRGKPYFGDYAPDFFDFIIIDECHRGGANNESTWRDILDYFAPAVQLGLTATPKRKDNVDTYQYFGEPVYVYSLREGINDGFLTPFRVRQIATTLDEYVFTPDDTVVEGDIEAGRRYEEKDFNRIIEIRQREAYRVKTFMDMIDQSQKTLVFCATQTHALVVRDLINQMKKSKDPNYCQRVTADDGVLGDQHLRDFQDNEKTIPTVLTTSQKLSTGVDARNVRNIVLLRPINSMIEFKQIIGRGTRLYDGKDYFTIYDFVKAHQLFNDPEWDGEPVEPEPVTPRPRPVGPDEPDGPEAPKPDDPSSPKPKKIKVKLADGKERTIDHMMSTTFWGPDGKPMSSVQFLQSLYGELPAFFTDEIELRRIWSDPATRKQFLQALTEKGYGHEVLLEMQQLIDAEQSDLFDVLANVAFNLAPRTRAERAAHAKRLINGELSYKQQEFIDFVLSHYVSVGVEELDQDKLKPLLDLKYHNSIQDAMDALGKPEEIGALFAGFQRHLYNDLTSRI